MQKFRIPMALMVVAVALATPASAGTANTLATATDMAQAASVNPGSVITATWLLNNPGAHAVDDDVVTPAGFPTHGANYALITSGRGNNVDCGCGQGTQMDGSYGTTHADHGDSAARDTQILKITYSVPSSHNHIHVQVQFLSEEYPDYTGTPYNDGAYVEWSVHSWNYLAGYNNPSAPNNFAKDPSDALLTINSASLTAADAAGSIYDGGTCRLTLYQEIEPGTGDLYVSVTDVSDAIFDTAMFFDNIKTVYKSSTPAATCNPMPPPVEFTAEFLNVCLETLFTVTSPEPTGPAIYKWEFGDNSFGSSTTNTITHKYTEPGTYSVAVSIYDSGTGETFEGAMDIEIANCELAADATYQLYYDEYYGFVKNQIPIFGGALGAMGEVTCVWSGPTTFENAGSCNTRIIHDVVDDFLIKLEVEDLLTGKTATDMAMVHVLPTPPSLSLDEAVPEIVPDDRLDARYAGVDSDKDGKPDHDDLCPNMADIGARDLDTDGLGDACDFDDDNDGVLDLDDNCRTQENQGLLDIDGDGLGDACDFDDDNDGVSDWKSNDVAAAVPNDNCRTVPNADQANLDSDGLGDGCDDDRDGDSVANLEDAQPDNKELWSDANRDGVEDTLQDLDTDPELTGTKSGSPVGVENRRSSPPWALALGGLGVAVVMVVVAAFMVTRRQT